jgi:hypothetical protein
MGGLRNSFFCVARLGSGQLLHAAGHALFFAAFLGAQKTARPAQGILPWQALTDI